MDQSSFISSFKALRFNYKTPLSVIIVLLLVELLLRAFWNNHYIPDKLYTLLTPYHDLGFEVHQDILDLGDNGKLHVSGNRVYNIHSQDLTLRAEDALYEFYGSSVTHGHQDYNYPLFLQQLGKARDKHFNVVNLSADGVGSLRINNILASTLEITPSMVFYHPHGSNEYEDERDHQAYLKINADFNAYLLKSYTISIMKRAIDLFAKTLAQASDSNAELIASSKPENIKRWNHNLNIDIQAFYNHPQLSGVPVIIIGRVERNLDDKGYNNAKVTEINNLIKQAMEKCDHCYYFDTVEVFAAQGDSNEVKNTLFVDNSHYSAQGHRVVANALFAFIETISAEQ